MNKTTRKRSTRCCRNPISSIIGLFSFLVACLCVFPFLLISNTTNNNKTHSRNRNTRRASAIPTIDEKAFEEFTISNDKKYRNYFKASSHRTTTGGKALKKNSHRSTITIKSKSQTTSRICNESITWTNLPATSSTSTTATGARTTGSQQRHVVFSDFLIGPGLQNCLTSSGGLTLLHSRCQKERVCRIDYGKPTLLFHFPHAMQLIYACISWWEYNSRNDDDQDDKVSSSTLLPLTTSDEVQRILSIPKSIQKALFSKQNKFTSTFLNHMENFLGLQIRVEDKMPPTSVARSIYVQPAFFSGKDGTQAYNVQSSNQLERFRNIFLQDLVPNSTKAETTSAVAAVDTDITPGGNKGSCVPRIGMLNRRGSREILNVVEITKALKSALSSSKSVIVVKDIEYFESKSFEHQLDFFATTDILISSHGAQLTGLPFMPSNRCSSLLELFPFQYFIPHYFGSLADASRIKYQYMYFVPPDTQDDGNNSTITEDGYLRTKAKHTKVCPNIVDIVESIQQMIHEWKECNCDGLVEKARRR